MTVSALPRALARLTCAATVVAAMALPAGPIAFATGGDGKGAIAGGSGGPLIVSATLQTLLGIIDFGLDPAAAVAAPRIHHQWAPAALAAEAGIERATLDDLARRGHTVRLLPFAGAVQIVTQEGGHMSAAAYPRKGGGTALR